jgi:nitrogen fixation/metabolism regulation signal transduction histidine kinase
MQGGAANRRIRNYLLNPRFQLKYSGYLVAVAIGLMLVLGTLLWNVANTAASQARTAVSQAEVAMRESQTSSRIIQMDQLSSAGDNPELVNTITQELHRVDQQAAENRDRVAQQRVEIEKNHRLMIFTLFGSSLALILILGAAGVVITHKVVGPVFKLKRLLRQVGSGRLNIKERLRKGDELEDLFEVFLQMVDSLKRSQEAELKRLEDVIQQFESMGGSTSGYRENEKTPLEKLRELRAEMLLALGSPESMRPPG